MALLLDTCAIIWLANGDPMSKAAIEAIDDAYATGEVVHYSPISAWEIGMLVARGRLNLTKSPAAWFASFAGQPGVSKLPLTDSALIESSFLPGRPPADPADRMIIATAREDDLTIVTRDRKIVDYGQSGHARILAC